MPHSVHGISKWQIQATCPRTTFKDTIKPVIYGHWQWAGNEPQKASYRSKEGSNKDVIQEIKSSVALKIGRKWQVAAQKSDH